MDCPSVSNFQSVHPCSGHLAKLGKAPAFVQNAHLDCVLSQRGKQTASAKDCWTLPCGLSELLRQGMSTGLVVDVDIVLLTRTAAIYQVAERSAMLEPGLENIVQARNTGDTLLRALSTEWEEEFLKKLTALQTKKAHEQVVRLDRGETLNLSVKTMQARNCHSFQERQNIEEVMKGVSSRAAEAIVQAPIYKSNA